MSLRLRLVIGLLVLVAIGLVVVDAVSYTQLRPYLYAQIDQQLESLQSPVLRELDFPGSQITVPPGTFAGIVTANGHIVERLTTATTKTPDLSGMESVLGYNPAPGSSVLFSVGTRGNSGLRYRVLAEVVPSGGTFVVALPLTTIQGTLHHLLIVEVLVSLGVLIALAALGRTIVALGLRPLRDIETTSMAIAAGDLSQRVDGETERTEIGRLSGSLNTMLAKIETAFAEKEASEERLRRFLADASHELRTPLTSIRGYAELFRRGAGERPEDLAKAMRRIESESERMGELVEDLLLLARLDQGRPLERAPVDLAQICRNVVTDASVVAPERSITIDAPPSLVVTGDGARLHESVANLVANAIVHTGSTASISVRVFAVPPTAVVEVTDTGPGMAPEEAERVFERFYRADPARARTSGGTGLGLAIVAAIVASHHGSVTLQTSPGAGATFRVELPLAG